MGPVDHSLHLKGKDDVTVLMMCGLQGSGKTTTCGKLGRMLKENGRRPLMVAADLQRPAAIDQLHVLGDQLGIPVFSDRENKDPVTVCNNAVRHAKKQQADVVILDTAGRLHIDDELMKQLERIDNKCAPDQIYLVVDAMTGQDAVNSAKAFNDALEIDGVIMTKLDGGRPGRCSAVGQARHRRTDQVHGYGREARSHRAVSPRPHGTANPRPGRRAEPGSKPRRKSSTRNRRPSSKSGCKKANSRSTTSAPKWPSLPSRGSCKR